MRKMATLLAAAAIALAPTAYAQTETPAVPETAQAPAPNIEKVEIVALQELSEADQTRVTSATSQTSEADLQSLRTSLDANQQAAAALQAEGLTTQSVIAVSMGADGTLLLITNES